MPAAARARLQLALGQLAVLGEEFPAHEGMRVFAATAREGGDRRRVVLHLTSRDGPLAGRWQSRLSQLADLAHPVLVPPVATGASEDGVWVIEPIPDGTTATERIEARGPLPIREAVQHLREIARALTVMHRRGLTHGMLDSDVVHLAGGKTLVSGMALAEFAEPSDDLAAFGRLAWAFFAGTRVPDAPRSLNRERPGVPEELADIVDDLLQRGGPRRITRAPQILEVFDAFPTPHASPLAGFFDTAGRGARPRRSRVALFVVGLVGLALLLAFLFSSGA